MSKFNSEFKRVAAKEFAEIIVDLCATNPFYKNNLDIKDSYEDSACWLAEDGSCGYAVTPNFELINVFSKVNGNGSFALQHAVQTYSYLHLNCYAGGYLEDFYRSAGFVEYRREPNWDQDSRAMGLPDVLFMRLQRG